METQIQQQTKQFGNILLVFTICILISISIFAWNLSEIILSITFESSTSSGTAVVNKNWVLRKSKLHPVSSECCINQGNSNSTAEFRTELHINILKEILLKIISSNCMHKQWLAFIINLLFYMPESNFEVMSVKEGK